VLVLWDVDHTLIENNGVNKETYAKAFEILTGRPAEHPAETEGRTEPDIVANMLAMHGIDSNYVDLSAMAEALQSATLSNVPHLRERGHILPGAREALEALQQAPGIVQSVLTGNLKPNAIAKLAGFGLNVYVDFEVGGYGSDDRVRANLVEVARRRAQAKFGITLGKSTTVVIGDTPRDVQAGRQGGAYMVAVASGSDSVSRLAEAGADLVFPDLQDTQALVKAVTSLQA
jgi:phosphoglycolate phosphatase-like HAD superfamily hydrolase